MDGRMKKGIIWFRNNLRLADNKCITRALDECDEVLCLYIMEAETWNPSAETPRMGSIRAQFILESLRELEEEIKELGGSIEFIKGRAVDEIPRVMESFGAEHCYAQKEDAWEETEQERLLANQINLTSHRRERNMGRGRSSFCSGEFACRVQFFSSEGGKEDADSQPFPITRKNGLFMELKNRTSHTYFSRF